MLGLAGCTSGGNENRVTLNNGLTQNDNKSGLSENDLLTSPSGKLYGPSLVNAWDEVEANIPSYSDLIDGNSSKNEGISYDNSKQNYIAYTFYLFNSGSEDLDYTMSFNIEYVDKDADSMIRVRLYEDGVLTTYAKDNPLGEYDDYRTTDFASEDVIVSKEYNDFKVGAVRQYSIVIWIEADDRDTTNEKIGGSLVLSMQFSVVDR